MFKVNFERAFDSVDWGFLDFIMTKMGFKERWRKWVRSCVFSASIAVLVNGTCSRRFKMSRSLRQGCPLLLFLFNLVVEAFRILINKTADIGLINYIKIGRSNCSITHLQFADNTLLFYRKNFGDLLNTKRILKCFQLIAGL